VESVGRLDGVAVVLERLGAVAADLHLGLHRATDLVGGFKAWARAGLPVQPAELA
jgi:rhodanese-related sulfurtransferase